MGRGEGISSTSLTGIQFRQTFKGQKMSILVYCFLLWISIPGFHRFDRKGLYHSVCYSTPYGAVWDATWAVYWPWNIPSWHQNTSTWEHFQADPGTKIFFALRTAILFPGGSQVTIRPCPIMIYTKNCLPLTVGVVVAIATLVVFSLVVFSLVVFPANKI